MAMAQMKPGVVYGKDYITMLAACKDGAYALPAVNVVGTNSVNAVLEAAARNKSDIIIQLSNGGAQFFAGQGLADGEVDTVPLLDEEPVARVALDAHGAQVVGQVRDLVVEVLPEGARRGRVALGGLHDPQDLAVRGSQSR